MIPVVALALLFAAPATRPDDPARIRAEVEAAAAAARWLDVGEVVYGRTAAGEGVFSVPAEVAALLDADVPAEAVLPLLGHGDPKVRVLTAAMLYDQDDPRLIDALLPLADDAAPAFREHKFVPLSLPEDEALTEPRPVGHAVRAMLRFHLRAARVGRYDDEVAAWRELQRRRGGRADTAGTFLVRFRRATGGTSPPPPDRLDDARRVIDAARSSLPTTEAFGVLSLMRDDDARAFDAANATRGYDPLLSLARRLPREARLAVLRGEPWADPELPPGQGARFLLEQAGELLLRRDAALLERLDPLAATATTRRAANPATRLHDFALARAELQPGRASDILTTAMERADREHDRDTRAFLALGLFRHAGDRATPFLLDWLFTDRPEPNANGFGTERFLAEARDADPAAFRRFAAAVVRDDRLGVLNAAETRAIAEAAEAALGRPLLPGTPRHGEGFGGQSPPPADWHAALRDTVDEWALPGPAR